MVLRTIDKLGVQVLGIKSSFRISYIRFNDDADKSLLRCNIPVVSARNCNRLDSLVKLRNAARDGRGAMAVNLESGTIGFRLAEIARRFPEQRAFVEGEAAITFAELDAAASRDSR